MDKFGMLNWTDDLPLGYHCKEIFLAMLEKLRPLTQPRILEVGTFAGTSIATMQEYIPQAVCTAIDNWGLEKDEQNICGGVDMTKVKDVFLRNTQGKVELIENDSAVALHDLIKQGRQFEFIYVDGSHRALDTLLDVTLAWILLPRGGILAIDDYTFLPDNDTENRPQPAVDFFMKKFNGKFMILNMGYRLFLQKL